MNDKEHLIKYLAMYAYNYDPINKFRLSSGQLSDEYLDCKQALCRAQTMHVMGNVILDVIPEEATAIGGLTMGADPIAMSTSQASAISGRNLNWFSVRKEPKGHGSNRLIEGSVSAGDSVVVVDDVVTTGASTVKAINCCLYAGLKICAVVVLVDREQSRGIKCISNSVENDTPVISIFKKDEIKEEWLKIQMIKGKNG